MSCATCQYGRCPDCTTGACPCCVDPTELDVDETNNDERRTA